MLYIWSPVTQYPSAPCGKEFHCVRQGEGDFGNHRNVDDEIEQSETQEPVRITLLVFTSLILRVSCFVASLVFRIFGFFMSRDFGFFGFLVFWFFVVLVFPSGHMVPPCFTSSTWHAFSEHSPQEKRREGTRHMSKRRNERRHTENEIRPSGVATYA